MTLLATLTALSPAGEASAAPVARAAAQQTKITLKVNSCQHCPMQLVQAISGRQHVWSTAYKHVKDGKVTFKVPTSRVDGMSINLDPRWSGVNAVTNVVIRYGQEKVGRKVTAAEAKAKKQAAGCLAATGLSGFTLNIQVRKFKVRDIQGNPSQAPRAWVGHTAAWSPPMTRTFKGSLGNQDEFYCTT
jgi:hypothetical protein